MRERGKKELMKGKRKRFISQMSNDNGGGGGGENDSQSLPLSLADPQGPGPWYSFMLVNIGVKPSVKKQTEIRCHSYPLLIQRVKNMTTAGDWQIIIVVGPFYWWDNAIRFSHLWSNRTRGQMPRTAKGIFLGKHFKNEGYRFLCLSQSKDELIKIVEKRKKKLKKEKEFKFPNVLNAERVDVSHVKAYLDQTSKLGGDFPSLVERRKKRLKNQPFEKKVN